MVLFRLVDRSIGVVSTLVLARLLAPADFGLVAMAMSIVAALEILGAFSFDLALIQNRDAERRHFDTAWTFNVMFGVANACILLALAVPAARLYGEPRVEGIMHWLAAYAAIQGLANIGVVAFQRDLELHKEFRFALTKRIIGFTVTLALAYTLRSYWALVGGTIATALAAVALSYLMHPYRPRFSIAARRELFHFSKWLLINNVLIFFTHRSTDLILGRYAGAQALGTYNVAYELANLPTTELVFPISRAVYPGYARMAERLEELRRGFLDVFALIVLFAVPAGIGITVLAEPVVRVLLGEKWSAAIPLIQILGIFGVLRASGSNSGSVYLALGVPHVIAYLALLFLAVLGTGLWLTVGDAGAKGAALSVLTAGAIQVPVGFVIVARQTGLGLSAFVHAAWRPLLSGIVMALLLTAMMRSAALSSAGDLVQLVLLVPLGAVIYFSSVFLLWAAAGKPSGSEAHLLPVVRQFLGRARAAVTPRPE